MTEDELPSNISSGVKRFVSLGLAISKIIGPNSHENRLKDGALRSIVASIGVLLSGNGVGVLLTYEASTHGVDAKGNPVEKSDVKWSPKGGIVKWSKSSGWTEPSVNNLLVVTQMVQQVVSAGRVHQVQQVLEANIRTKREIVVKDKKGHPHSRWRTYTIERDKKTKKATGVKITDNLEAGDEILWEAEF